MIGPGTREAIETARADEKVTLVLQWQGAPGPTEMAQIAAASDRRAAARDYFKRRKSPLFDWVRGRSEFQVRDMENLGNALVTASGADWRRVIADPGSPLHEADVVVLPNVRLTRG